MIVVCDTFDYENYPVYVSAGQNVHEIVKEYNGKSMQTVAEVYNLSIDLEEQIDAMRVFNY